MSHTFFSYNKYDLWLHFYDRQFDDDDPDCDDSAYGAWRSRSGKLRGILAFPALDSELPQSTDERAASRDDPPLLGVARVSVSACH